MTTCQKCPRIHHLLIHTSVKTNVANTLTNPFKLHISSSIATTWHGEPCMQKRAMELKCFGRGRLHHVYSHSARTATVDILCSRPFLPLRFLQSTEPVTVQSKAGQELQCRLSMYLLILPLYIVSHSFPKKSRNHIISASASSRKRELSFLHMYSSVLVAMQGANKFARLKKTPPYSPRLGSQTWNALAQVSYLEK